MDWCLLVAAVLVPDTFQGTMDSLRTACWLNESVKAAKMQREIGRLTSSFPCYAYRREILESVQQSKVCIVIGGCGGHNCHAALLTAASACLARRSQKLAMTVVVVLMDGTGETGSGKSTQIAQYLADGLLAPGKKVGQHSAAATAGRALAVPLHVMF